MPPAGFEPTISASERPQTYALDRAAAGTGWSFIVLFFIYRSYMFQRQHVILKEFSLVAC